MHIQRIVGWATWRLRPLLAAASLSSAIVGCSQPQTVSGPDSPDPYFMSKTFVPVDPATQATAAPELRAGRLLFTHDTNRTAEADEKIYVGGRHNSVVLIGMTTPNVVTSSSTMSRTIWNGQLFEGSIKVGSGNLDGSVSFLTFGELYVEARQVTGMPPAGSTPSPDAFPIVLTTSGGVRVGSSATTWFCWCEPGFDPIDHEYFIVMLDNPLTPSPGALYVGKGGCWGGVNEPCVRKVLIDTQHFIHVKGAVIDDPALISSEPGLQGRIDEAKRRAVEAGLRMAPQPR